MAKEGEQKTELRVLFEESMKAPAKKFSLFLSPSLEGIEDEADSREEAVYQVAVEKKRPLSEVFLEAEAELRRRWPEPVGDRFVRSETDDANWQATKEHLKSQTKKKMKEAIRKGMTKSSAIALGKQHKANH